MNAALLKTVLVLGAGIATATAWGLLELALHDPNWTCALTDTNDPPTTTETT